jgi:hypothetical protein
MTDLPDPKSPLNEMERRVYGVDSCRHPVTGFPIVRAGEDAGHHTAANEQAYLTHLPEIRRTHGDKVYQEYRRRLDEFVKNGGQVELPPRAQSV